MGSALLLPLEFWLAAAAMVAAALAFVLPALVRAPRHRGPARRELNVQVWRARRDELDREHAEGRIGAAEHEARLSELAHGVLEETGEEDRGALAHASSPRVAPLAVALAFPLAAAALYATFGTPDALRGDGVDAAALVRDDAGPDELARHLARHPGDARARVLSARLAFAADLFDVAAGEYERALANPKVARDPAVWCEYADALGMAQGGTLDGRPRELVERALAIDPLHPKALEMAGSAAYERRDYAGAAKHWRTLLARMPDGAAGRVELVAAIERAERRARFVLP